MSSFNSNENIRKKEDQSYYVVSANKASKFTKLNRMTQHYFHVVYHVITSASRVSLDLDVTNAVKCYKFQNHQVMSQPSVFLFSVF